MRLLTRRTDTRAGFTLMELVVVMTIIAILAGAVMIRVTQNIQHAKRATALADIQTLDTALGIYEANNGDAPSEQQGLGALVTKPTTPPEPTNWQGPYLKSKAVPKDPWGHEYVYKVTGEGQYEVFSYGKDGQAGGTGYDADVTRDQETQK